MTRQNSSCWHREEWINYVTVNLYIPSSVYNEYIESNYERIVQLFRQAPHRRDSWGREAVGLRVGGFRDLTRRSLWPLLSMARQRSTLEQRAHVLRAIDVDIWLLPSVTWASGWYEVWENAWQYKQTISGTHLLLLARLMGQYCFARWRLSSSFVVACNAAGGRAGRPAAGRVGGRAADTARRSSTVTSR